MRNLKNLILPKTADELREFVDSTPFTIFEKIEFSDISREVLAEKLKHLREVSVPNRSVLKNLSDEEVVFYWFRNWLHPLLKHVFKLSPKDKRGCSPKVLADDSYKDMLHFYENGQQNFQYTLADVEAYINEV